MKKISVSLLILIFMLSVFSFGCNAAKKPEAQVAPEVPKITTDSDVTFNEVNLDTIPVSLKDVVEKNKELEGHSAVLIDGNVYALLISDSDDMYEMKQVRQRAFSNFSVLEISLLEKDVEGKESQTTQNQIAGTKNRVQLFKLNTNTLGQGVIFKVTGMEESKKKPEETKTENTTNVPKPVPENKETTERVNISVDTPKPQSTVSTPLEVKGTTSMKNGTIQARLRDTSGNILAEGIAKVSATGEYSVKLNFTKPAQETPGKLELFTGNEENLKIIPLKIK